MHRWTLPLMVACGPALTDDPEVPVDPELTPFPIDEVDVTRFVDPMLGTRGQGNVIPGALVPHGMVRASPDTLNDPGAIDAYDWSSDRIEGFTHTHLEGPGGSANGYSQILLLPQAGPRQLDRDLRPEPFSHDDEEARPGYYRVRLQGSDVDVALTATGHAAIHRYTFPEGEGRIVLDLGHSMADSVGGSVTLDGATVAATGRYRVHPFAALVTLDDGTTAYTTIHAWMELSFTPAVGGVWQGRSSLIVQPGATTGEGAWLGAWVDLPADAPRTVEVRVGISRISVEQARRNLEAEVGQRSFEEVAEAADAAWNTLLNRVAVEGSDDDKTRFYTALYHALMQPADYTEVGGDYAIGASGRDVVRQAEGFRYHTDDWCAWDTFRTSHPLRTLVEPELADDIANSMLVTWEEGGWLDKCSWNATGYSRVMTGNPQVSILVDAGVKGLYGDRVDPEAAWQALDELASNDIPMIDGVCGYTNLGTPEDYVTLGWVSHECDPGQAASMTLEYAYADWVTARWAEHVGRDDEADVYDARSGNWKNTWNDAYRFAQSRRRDGSWVEPFDPDLWSDFNGFTEATSWIYSFSVQHDVPGLVEKVGGKAAMVERLDAFFDGGRFDVSNQPSFHVPWLYAAVGDPAGTQRRVRDILDTHYGTGPEGLPGNDDAGSTSAFAVLSILGLYPIAPGGDRWTLSAPLVPEATLHLHPGFYEGGAFTVRAVGDLATERYVQSATWRGEPLERAWLTHEEIVGGGVLEVVLGAAPSAWGAAD